MAEQYTLVVPAVTVTATRAGEVVSVDLPISDGQYTIDLNAATLLKESSTTLSDSQYTRLLGDLSSNNFGSSLNTVDYTKYLLDSAGVSGLNYMAAGSISSIYQGAVDYFKYTSYGDLIDPGDYWDSFDPGFNFNSSYSSCQLNFSDADNWLGWVGGGLWNTTTSYSYLFDKTTKVLGESAQVEENYVSYATDNARYGSPIAIDLDGDGFEIVRLRDSSTLFDLTGDGKEERTSWLFGDDAFLAHDANSNGSVDGVSELFGGLERGEGYAKLAAYDSNDDGVINSDDALFDQLSVWRDKNQNGVSDIGELQSLQAASVSELTVAYQTVNGINNGSLIGEESSATVNGNLVQMADIYFRYEVDSSVSGLFEGLNSSASVATVSVEMQPPSEFASSVNDSNEIPEAVESDPQAVEFEEQEPGSKTHQITFKDWYAATPSKPVSRLQVMAEAMAGFVEDGRNPLLDQKVENFNFTSLVGAFDAARAANSSLTSWALTNALTNFQLAGSDTAAMGGDLAYQYGKNGTLAGIGVTPALSTLSDTNLGTNPQALNSLASLQTGTVRLS